MANKWPYVASVGGFVFLVVFVLTFFAREEQVGDQVGVILYTDRDDFYVQVTNIVNLPDAAMYIPGSLPERSPQLDVYCENGSHVGLNHQGKLSVPFWVQPGNVSPLNTGQGAWIYIPNHKLLTCRFVVSTYNQFRFLLDHPDINSKISDPKESYEIYARYFGNDIRESEKLKNVEIKIGSEHVYDVKFENNSITPKLIFVKEANIASSTPCPRGNKFCQYF